MYADVGSVGGALGWAGTAVAARDGMTQLNLWVEVDDEEHNRRAGAGAVSSLRALAALCSLPQGLPVREGSLTRGARNLMRRLPMGFVHNDAGNLVRMVRSPARIFGVVAVGADWDRTAFALGAYVTVCPRVAAVKSIDDRVLAEALVWGIGLTGDDGTIRLEPQPASIELGPYQWWIAERAYSAWLAHDQRRRAQASI